MKGVKAAWQPLAGQSNGTLPPPSALAGKAGCRIMVAWLTSMLRSGAHLPKSHLLETQLQ
jgi:hypothetical protein